MKRTILTMLALLLACALLAGCGASSSMNTAVGGGAAAAAPQENYDMAMEESGVSSGETGTLLPEAGGRKLVYTATLDLETKTYTDARTALLDALDKAGGYVESNEEGGSAERGSRWSRLTLRVPADRYADFLNEASGVGNLVNKQEQMEDITASYVDVQARLESLETQRTRLTELMAQAENLTDLLQIQQQLSDVEYQIESYTAQMRAMDDQVDYCTVEVYLNEVDSLTIVEPTFGERIGEAFANSWVDFGEFCQDLAVFLVYRLPALLVLAVILVIVLLIAHRSRKRIRATAAARPVPPVQPGAAGADYGPLYAKPESDKPEKPES